MSAGGVCPANHRPTLKAPDLQFNGNRRVAEITPALEALLNTTPPRITVQTIRTGKRGRAPKIYSINQ